MDWPLLATLEDADRREVLAVGRARSFRRNEVVCHAGDPADALHVVEHGRLSVTVSLATGDTSMINVLGPGSYFGELALLRADHRRTATITALEPARTIAITYGAFRRLCQARPSVERSLSTLLADRIDRLSQQLIEATYLSLDRRICRRLAELCEGAEAPVRIDLTQTQVGELTGGTRPSVNQCLQRLVELHVVALGRGRIEVLDLARLRSRAGL